LVIITVGVAGALTRQGVGESRSHRTILAADQQVDMSDFIPFADQGFPDEHRHG
jgi:hypothetical protein